MQKYLQQSLTSTLMRISGIAVVFRNRMRSRSAARDLATSIAITGIVIGCAYLQTMGFGSKLHAAWSIKTSDTLLMRWAIGSTAAVGAVTAVLSAVLGAAAMPSIGEFEPVQSSLLTRLKPLDICAGRLAAGLWFPVTMVLESAAFWLASYLLAGRQGVAPLYAAVIASHIIILLFSFSVGAVSFLSSVKRRPGRNTVTGFSAALIFGTFCIVAIWLINPVITKMARPQTLIDTTLVINPLVGTATAYKVDILRGEWLYNHLQAQDYPFLYPSVWVSGMFFLAIGCGALGVSAIGLKRAYR